MDRYGCFKIMTNCGSCGLPVPVNGPMRRITCTSCFNDVNIESETLTGFFENLQEEYENLNEGEGMESTLMGGDGTFKYTYYRLAPHCSSCKGELQEIPADTDGTVSCVKCGAGNETFPAPAWLKEAMPSVLQIICAEREEGTSRKAVAAVDNEGAGPVAMNCPQCGGSLIITGSSTRITKCGYCSIDVYVPDAIWLRLHPVKIAGEWYVRFEIVPLVDKASVKNANDETKRKAAKKVSVSRSIEGNTRKIIIFSIKAVAVVVVLALFTAGTMNLMQFTGEEIGNVMRWFAGFIVISCFITGTAWGAIGTELALKFMAPGRCRAHMTALAEKYNWKHEGISKYSMGYISGKWKGREFELRPDDRYALTVDISRSLMSLSTDPDGYYDEKYEFFSSGNQLFDEIFPVRYVNFKLITLIEENSGKDSSPLAPVFWFLERWKNKLAKMEINWSSICIHLAPGHEDTFINPVRYLYPEDIEPLMLDTYILARAIEDVNKGQKPELPDSA